MSILERSDPGPSNRLVRTFSDELQQKRPGEALSRGLAAKVALDRHRDGHYKRQQQQWDVFLLDAREMAQAFIPDEEAVLLDQSQRLYAAWTKFRDSLPTEQRQELGPGERPDIRYLIKSVARAASTWKENQEQTRTGRVKATFFRLCDNCQNHSSLFAVIPSHEKYLCLLTGSLSAIAQASVNHQNIAEGVAESLESLSKDIEFWNRQIAEHGNIAVLRQHVQELYIVVFEFFTEVFSKWSQSSWRRFRTSFNDDAFDKLFTAKRDRITAIEKRIDREITLEFQKKMKTSMEKLVTDQQKLLTQMPQHQLAYQRALLGASLQQFLEQQSRLPEQPGFSSLTYIPSDDPKESPIYIRDPDSPEAEHDPTLQQKAEDRGHREGVYEYNREDVHVEIAVYVDQFRHQVQKLVQMTSSVPLLMTDKQAYSKLLSWIDGIGSQTIWIQGPHGTSSPSQNSMTAISLVALSHKNNIPCISYFCSLPDARGSEPVSKSDQLMAMLASLVAQLVLLVPGHCSTSPVDLSPSRFSSLAHSAAVDDALHLICDLRAVVPRYMHCVIDNFQTLEDRSDQSLTRKLLMTIATLCMLDRGGGSEREESALVTKVCLTTDGFMDSLGQAAAMDLITKVEFGIEADDPIASDAIEMNI